MIRIKRIFLVATIMVTMIISTSFFMTSKTKAVGTGITFAEQFASATTASVIAEYFGKVATDEIDSNDILTTGMYLANTGIDDLTGISIFVNLEELQVQENNLTFLPDEMNALTKLWNLNADYNQIAQLPADWSNLTSLNYLYLAHNKLTSLPDGIGALNKLFSFNLSYNDITTLPSTIENMSNLFELLISHNPNLVLDESITKAPNLFTLHIDGTNLTTIPEVVSRIPNLYNLSVSENHITTLPDYLANATKLQYLFLNGNQLQQLPDYLSTFNIVQLTIARNNFIELPEFIANYSLLEYFDASYNQLTSLPTNFLDLAQNNAWIHTINVDENLLPSDVNEYLTLHGFKGYDIISHVEIALNPTIQDKLVIKNTPSFDIRTQSDFDAIDYIPYLGLQSNRPLSIAHQYQLENLLDENLLAVSFSDYLQGGKVVKSGVVSAQVRATGAGLFPNTSDQALSDETIAFNFIMPSEYTLQFNLNGKTGVIPEQQVLQEGMLATPVNAPTAVGFIFKGWNTLPSGSGMDWDFASTTMPANNVTLYAQWEATVNQYTLRFDLNGGQGTIPTEQVLSVGDKAIQPTQPTRVGYTFKGWNMFQAGTGAFWDFSSTTMPASNVALYAQWEANINQYTVRFDLNGGQGIAPNEQFLKVGDKIIQPNNPTREGYIFNGWNSEAMGSGVDWNFVSMSMPATDMTLYAQWEQTTLPPGTADTHSRTTLLFLLVISTAVLLIYRYRKQYIYKKVIQDNLG